MKIQDIKPLHNLALLRERTVSSLIHTPDNAGADARVHEVVAVGPGIMLESGSHRPTVVQPGDIVMICSGNYTIVRADGVKLLLVPDEGIRCIVGHAETWPDEDVRYAGDHTALSLVKG